MSPEEKKQEEEDRNKLMVRALEIFTQEFQGKTINLLNRPEEVKRLEDMLLKLYIDHRIGGYELWAYLQAMKEKNLLL